MPLVRPIHKGEETMDPFGTQTEKDILAGQFEVFVEGDELVFTDSVTLVATRTRARRRLWERSMREIGKDKMNKGLARKARRKLHGAKRKDIKAGRAIPTSIPTSLNWKQAQTRVAFAMLICMVAALFTASNHALYDSRAVLEIALPAAAFLYQAYTMIRAYPANWVRFFGTLIAIVLIDYSVVYYCLIVL
jgi:hypothetical protein